MAALCAGRRLASDRQEKAKRAIAVLKQNYVAWLRAGEVGILDSFQEQLDRGRTLTAKQLRLLNTIGDRASSRRLAPTLPGGAPGSGRGGVR